MGGGGEAERISLLQFLNCIALALVHTQAFKSGSAAHFRIVGGLQHPQ